MKNTFKKAILVLVAILMLFSLFGQFMVSAEDGDSMAPEVGDNDLIVEEIDPEDEVEVIKDVFEVVSISSSGVVTVVDTFEDFDLAHKKMKEDKDRAIRYEKSDSPLKYIAATRAIAYSAPKTAATINIYDINLSGTRTYISPGYDMSYFSTLSFDKSKNHGVAHIGISGFEARANLKDIDIIPMVYVENSIRVDIKRYPKPIIPKISHYTVKQGSKRENVVFVNHRGGSTSEHYIGPAKDTVMQLGRKYYSRDGVTMYTNPDFREGSKVGVYYNYYQYLPLRTKSDVPASVLNQYIENKKGLSKPSAMLNSGEVFIQYGEQYGMNPLLVFAMGIHESGWGVSNFAINNNNLFGWDAVDSNPSNAKKYESLEVGIKEHMALQLRGYLDVNYPNYSAKDNITYRKDGRYNGGHLGNRGTGLNLKYASDPYWGIKIAQYAYLIDDLAGLVDYQKYNLAIVTDGDEFLAKRSNVSNTNEKYNFNKDDIFYNYKGLNGYMHNVTIAVEDFDANNYKTQSFATIDQNFKVSNIYNSSRTPALDYNWERSSGYFKKSKARIIINKKANSNPIDKDLINAIKAVEKAENSKLQSDVTSAKSYISKVSLEKDQQPLLNRLIHIDLVDSIIRFGGANREETAVLASQSVYKHSNSNIILAGSAGEVDALTGTLLAASLDAPLLITKVNNLSEVTKNEMLRLNANKVYILGGFGVVSKKVEDQIKNLGINVVRIQGSDRFETAVKIAKQVKPSSVDHAFVVLGIPAKSGDALADALAVGPASAKLNSPVFLVRNNSIPDATKAALKDLNVSSVTIIGGGNAVSEKVQVELEDLVTTVDRIFGDSREQTAVEIANKYFSSSNRALIANSGSSADALVGGYLGKKLDSPILLTNNRNLTLGTDNYLSSEINNVQLLGGSAVISEDIHRLIASLIK